MYEPRHGIPADIAGCAKNGANMVLHHLGDSTLSDVKELEKECAAAGAKTVVVAGDISNEQTAKDVSRVRRLDAILTGKCVVLTLILDCLSRGILIFPPRRPNFQRRYLSIPHLPRPPLVIMETSARRESKRGILRCPSSCQPNGQTGSEPNNGSTRIDRRDQ